PDDSSEASPSKSDEPQAREPQAREPQAREPQVSEPKAREPEPTAASKRGRGFDKRRSQSDNLAPARWVPCIGDQVRFAARHRVETDATLDSVGVITEIGAGPAGSRLIGINHVALRLESEVELIARAAESNGQATTKNATDKPSRGNVAAE
ncbi:MAG: hypothetical protein KDA71_15125, partial [Planctomycetales bacterium]|nr:hypothetical protein [Planctomycetales bacterium]